MNIDKSSWHYRVAYFGVSHRPTQTTICEYAKYFIRGVFVIAVVIGVVSLVSAAMVVLPLLMIGVSIYHQSYAWMFVDQPSSFVAFASVGVLIWLILFVAFLIFEGPYLYRKIMSDVLKKEQTESVFVLWIRSVKEKTCFKITFVDNKQEAK